MILGFDTSGPRVGVALVRDGTVIALSHEDMARGQAERLLPMIDELLRKEQTSWASLAKIGVGTGPGNFTGIRISVSAARGLAMGLGVPAVGVSMHEALAYGTSGAVRTVLEARRDHVYVQDFLDGQSMREPEIFLASAVEAVLQRQSERCSNAATALKALGPEAVLSRGYSVTLDESGNILTDPDAVRSGDRLTTKLAGGEIRSTAE